MNEKPIYEMTDEELKQIYPDLECDKCGKKVNARYHSKLIFENGSSGGGHTRFVCIDCWHYVERANAPV